MKEVLRLSSQYHCLIWCDREKIWKMRRALKEDGGTRKDTFKESKIDFKMTLEKDLCLGSYWAIPYYYTCGRRKVEWARNINLQEVWVGLDGYLDFKERSTSDSLKSSHMEIYSRDQCWGQFQWSLNVMTRSCKVLKIPECWDWLPPFLETSLHFKDAFFMIMVPNVWAFNAYKAQVLVGFVVL